VKVLDHHKELVKQLDAKLDGLVSVFEFHDNAGQNGIPIATFRHGKQHLHLTVGLSDTECGAPPGHYEMALAGHLAWMPNALASSRFWLGKHPQTAWPVVCEDVVRDNAKSVYRHVGFVPSKRALRIKTAPDLSLKRRVMLGIPLRDKEISLTRAELYERASALYPAILL
jgi:hypothetical protein